jgi:head-tail adaptor
MNLPEISELTERIDILEVAAPYDIDGSGTKTATFAAGIWAKVEPLAGGLTDTTQQEQTARQPYNIWIRYIDGVTPFQQLDWGGDRLVMTAPPEEIVSSRWILIHAEQRTSRKL